MITHGDVVLIKVPNCGLEDDGKRLFAIEASVVEWKEVRNLLGKSKNHKVFQFYAALEEALEND